MLQVKKTKNIVAIILVFISLFSFIPVNAEEAYPEKVILGGTPFGLKIFTNGVIVIRINDDDSPANQCGIKINDIITKANGTNITSNETLKEIIENSDGETITLTLSRDSQVITKKITPKRDLNGNYALGMWIRDSTAGIGTVTFFDYENNKFGALGHGICDKDTGMLMPLSDGEILSATISNFTKGSDGCVGGLNGFFDNDKIGDIKVNNDYGIYGYYENTNNSKIVEIADDNEIKTGKAKIVSTINKDKPEEYDVEIVKVDLNENSGHNYVIKVTDKKLIEKTGGIIQGMSGSPIIQNGKLIGAVTHVFVNSPEQGYGISISNMLSNYRLFE